LYDGIITQAAFSILAARPTLVDCGIGCDTHQGTARYCYHNVQVDKLEVKMRYFEELEASLEKERGALENAWTSLFVERTQFAQAQLTTPAPPVSTPGGGGAGNQGNPPSMQTPAPSRFAPQGYTPGTGSQGGMVTPGTQPGSGFGQQPY
jgi:hypothetical protein